MANSTESSFSELVESTWDRQVCIFTQEISLAINIITLFIGFVIITGNVLVLLVLIRYPSKRFTPLYWLLIHLASADLLIGLTVFFWYGVAELMQLLIGLSEKVVFYGLSIVAVMASFQGLMMIALDRYVLILHSVKYTDFITRRRTIAAILLMWIWPLFLQVIAPIAGWSCVKHCDCRVHNLRPDDVYCFDDSCSQQLPPLKSLQLFLASFFSCVFFLITLVLYGLMFYSINQQTKRVKGSTASSRRSSRGIQRNVSGASRATTSKQSAPQTPGDPGAKDTDDNVFFGSEKGSGSALAVGSKENERSSSQNIDGDNSLKIQPDGNRPPPSPCTPVTPNQVIYRQSDQQGPISPTLTVTLRGQKYKPNNSSGRLSVSQSVINRLRHLTAARRKRRTNAGRRREVRVMRSMFLIMTVFVITTCPLMLFIMYTYGNNDRGLKEVFNILLQVTTLNSLLNPFLYFSRIPMMRKRLRKLLKIRYLRHLWSLHVTKRNIQPNGEAYRPENSDSWESAQSDSMQ